MASEIEDLGSVRKHFQLDTIAVLGHSWGALLAMEYAIRHQDRVSHLILMISDAASHDDRALIRQEYLSRTARFRDEMQALASSPQFMVCAGRVREVITGFLAEG